MAYQRTSVDSDIRGTVRKRELRRAGKAARQLGRKECLAGLIEGIDALYEGWALIVEG